MSVTTEDETNAAILLAFAHMDSRWTHHHHHSDTSMAKMKKIYTPRRSRIRLPFKIYELDILKALFRFEPYPSTQMRELISIKFRTTRHRITCWFQNQRAKQRKGRQMGQLALKSANSE